MTDPFYGPGISADEIEPLEEGILALARPAVADLDAAIRTALDEFCTADWCAEKGKAAILAVLDEHPLNDDHECVKEIVGYSVQAWYREEPCPTLLAIAKGLGIQT